ncbi:glycoside hydrolase family 97 catalytic domain-containing protein [Lentisphaerota bacterium WC36G]|nr:glycoside hydrolase family 97 catalytic domain-containing protein [Lentisphaerae bacterium WC36]
MKKKLFLIGILASAVGVQANDCQVTKKFTSVDGTNSLHFNYANSSFKFCRNNRELLILKNLSFKTKNKIANLKFLEQKNVSEKVQVVWGKRAVVDNDYSEVTFSADKKNPYITGLTFRIYNDAIAFRYNLKNNFPVKNFTEYGEVLLTQKMIATCYRGENSPQTPAKLTKFKNKLRTPILLSNDFKIPKYFISLTEANCLNYNFLDFKVKNDNELYFSTTVKYKNQQHSPWRVFLLSDNINSLLDSDTIANLNPVANQEKFKWVKPGVCFWDWRAWGYTADDGFKYGLNLESWLRFVDFAHDTKVPYLLLDANWYGHEFNPKSNPLDPSQWNRINTLLDYAKKKDVKILLYLNDVASNNYDIDKVFAMYHKKGVAGVKYGFLRVKGQQNKIAKTQMLIEKCAKNHLMIDFHDNPVLPTGEFNTYPNAVTKEFCHAQADAKRSYDPQGFLRIVMVDNIAGPIDMTNGFFDLNTTTKRPRVFQKINSTIVAETARTLVAFSGLVVLPDAADAYKKHSELFKFIALQQQPWQQSKTVKAEFDKYIAVARKNKHGQWLLAVVNGNYKRTVEVPLNFLENKNYQAKIFTDTDETHYKSNKESYQQQEQNVDNQTSLSLNLAAGGGACIIFDEIK